MASHELVTAPIARLGVIPLPYTKPHPLAVHDQSEHTHRLFVSLVLFSLCLIPRSKILRLRVEIWTVSIISLKSKCW